MTVADVAPTANGSAVLKKACLITGIVPRCLEVQALQLTRKATGSYAQECRLDACFMQ